MTASATPEKKESEAVSRIRASGARAKAEADARKAEETPIENKKEIGGRNGPEPTRYGDWEHKGLISDF